MKTIATFSKPEEAHLFRMRLEAAGIPAFVQDEYIVQMDWLYSNAIGGVRVQIADEDVQAAREFLAADADEVHVADEDMLGIPTADDEKTSESSTVNPTCPACGSDETKPDPFPHRVSLFGFFATDLPFITFRNRWRCESCKSVFRVNEPRS